MKRLILMLAVAALAAGLPGALAAKTVQYDDYQTFDTREGAKLTVDVSIHDVFVTVGRGSSIEVKVTMEVNAAKQDKAERYLNDHIPKFETKGDDLVIRARPKSKWNFGFFSTGRVKAKARIDITVPEGIHLNLDTASGDCSIDGDLGDADVSCDTASGDVTIRGAMRDLMVDTASGDLNARLDRPLRELGADTASGDVTVIGGAGRVDIDTASGDVEVEGLTGDARLNTASGDVEASWNRVDESARVLVDTASGDVWITLPDGADVSGGVNTASGDIDSDFPGDSSHRGRRFDFDGRRGDLALRVDTASGDVTIRGR